MKLRITSVDVGPNELRTQVPVCVTLLKQIPGPDRPDYWLAMLERTITWLDEGVQRSITHVVLAPRFMGSRIEPGAANLGVGLAYVIDQSLLTEASLSFSKCQYVAVAILDDVSP